MVLVKVLGGIDLISALTFFLMVFGFQPFIQIILFCSFLLLIKSLFLLGGDVLSLIDLLSSIILVLSLFLTLPAIMLWTPAFLLMAKGIVSFF